MIFRRGVNGVLRRVPDVLQSKRYTKRVTARTYNAENAIVCLRNNRLSTQSFFLLRMMENASTLFTLIDEKRYFFYYFYLFTKPAVANIEY